MGARPDMSFSSRAARVQYHLLMILFRFAVNRWFFGWFTRGLARFFDPSNAVIVTLPTGGRFRIALNDGYWTRFALFNREYEPEVGAILRVAAAHTGFFCDAGANKGYWTSWGSTLFQRITAVEAASKTFGALMQNVDGMPKVTCRRAAIYSVSGRQMSFVNVENSHASAHLGDQPEGGHLEMVETISLDDLIPPGTRAIIKLDVEGAEIEAMRGATRCLADGSVLIYEDHGADLESETSRYLFELGDMWLCFAENPTERLTGLKDVQVLKSDRFKGYNFLAARADSPLLASLLNSFAKD